jgi:hypothetical protein
MLAPNIDNLSKVQFLHNEAIDPVSAQSPTPAACGYPVDPRGMLTAVCWESKNKPAPDVHMSRNVNTVSERIRNTIGRIEPNVHQFLPASAEMTALCCMV